MNASRNTRPIVSGPDGTKAAADTTAPRDTDAPTHLRERILATSRNLLDRDGVAGLSMREVARQTGVTHQAPYHHFQDRESILAELVMRGFTELGRRLAQANDLAVTHGKRAALLASGEAYVGFAMEQPGVFRVMFRPDVCDPSRFPLVTEAGEKAYGELLRLVNLMHGADCAQSLSTVYWAHVHGMALLMLDGPLSRRIPDVQARIAHMHEAGRLFADMMLGKGS